MDTHPTVDSKLWLSNILAGQFFDLSGYIADDVYIEKAKIFDTGFINYIKANYRVLFRNSVGVR